MTVANHALAGFIITLRVSQPLIALPLTFASHFLLTRLPHFGVNKLNQWRAGIQQYETFAPGIFMKIVIFVLFLITSIALLNENN